MRELYCILNSILFAVVLNLLIPYLFRPLATPEEIKPPNGPEYLTFKGQIMHMLVHHNQTPLSSSLVVALIVGLSVMLSYTVRPIQTIREL